MGLFEAIGRGLKKGGAAMRAIRNANFYGTNYPEYVQAQIDMLTRSYQQDQEERDAKRAEREARDEERRYMRTLREQAQEDRTRSAKERSQESYRKAGELGLVVTPSGKVFLDEGALPPTDLSPEEQAAIRLGLVRRGESVVREQGRKREETVAEHAQRVAEEERMARLRSELDYEQHKRTRDFDNKNQPPPRAEKPHDYLEEARQTLLRNRPEGAPPPSGDEIAKYAETLRLLRSDSEIAARVRSNEDELFSPSPWASEPTAQGVGLEQPAAKPVGLPQLVKYQGKMVPFDDLPPDAKARVMAALGGH